MSTTPMTDFTPSAKDVMTLRQKTGLGMMDCKSALTETKGDMKAAEALLRDRMKGKMDTRTDRAAGEGQVAVAVDGSRATIVEVRAETDFTARNDAFRRMIDDVARMALDQPAGAVGATDAIKARIDDVRITTGENISLARGESLRGSSFGSYIHHGGKLGVIVQYEGAIPADVLAGVCMHVAAHVPTPQAVDESGMPADVVASTRAAAVKEAQESGKPAQIAEKIAEGKVRKFFEENTLLGQKYVKDDKKSVREILPAGARITRFVRYVVGGGEA